MELGRGRQLVNLVSQMENSTLVVVPRVAEVPVVMVAVADGGGFPSQGGDAVPNTGGGGGGGLNAGQRRLGWCWRFWSRSNP